jgi:ATP-dependent helicase/nuclease subunit A
MTRRLRDPMPDAITLRQRNASDPSASVWVTANAGSGKTYVLTARVLRLLLGGAKPEEILCLTYTKAAAAEMRSRVAERLGQWTLASEPELVRDLTKLQGAAPTAAQLNRARTMFAHALDTPGGLRIQTIHAFCEAVLHRFPKEAGVPFDFSVIEDFERDAMLREAREQVIAAGIRGSSESAAVETLFDLMSDFSIETAIVEALNQQPLLRKVLLDIPGAKRELRRLAGDPPSRAAHLDAVARGYGLTATDHAALFAVCRPDPAGDDLVDRLSRIDLRHPDPEALFEAYLTKEFTARKTLIRKAVAALVPLVAEKLVREAARLEQACAELARADLVERSEALLDVVAAISVRYERAKRARSLLDFDDLIERLAALLKDGTQGPWVLYKLDQRLSHILVDEGQDTNPQQWDVIDALVDDFFTGDSAAARPRTLFAVGDQKQSIFSFQGADPLEFLNARDKYAMSARSVKLEIQRVQLQHSFRTLPNVLAAVDRVFEKPELRQGVLEPDFIHDTARAEPGGIVTLWPPLKQEEEEVNLDEWPTEPPASFLRSAPRRVAERIASEIRGWIESGRLLGSRRRPVRAEDVLILVQVRSVLFHEVIRALIRQGIPTPGADRLAVTTHIGTLDLMALGDVLSSTADNLQLAALLRSPLFEVSEDELFQLARPRGDKETLWSALAHSSIPSAKAAYEQLSDWRNRLDFERPFNFYAEVLYAAGGLRRFRARFGSEIDDVVAEFLDLALAYEQRPQPSLLGFLAELRSREVIIKRELAEPGGGVRVMTVHGAKGLEAPIVILADAATTEEGRDRRSIYMSAAPPLFFHASSKATHIDQTIDYKDDADADQKAEYWRKLYVAMTRAEDELYVTGHLTKARDETGTWYEAIRQGLGADSEIVTDASGTEIALVYPRERATLSAANANAAAAAAPTPLSLPPLPAYRLPPIVRPSRAFTDTEPQGALATAAERLGDPRDPEAARQEGIALHALLQHLGRIDRSLWQAVAGKALAVLIPGLPHSHARLAAKAISILTRPALAEVFGPGSRAEVPFLANVLRKGAPATLAGRIDRLVVTPSRVLIVDFKSDAAPPSEASGVPPGYATQLGLYALVAGQLFPDLEVEAAILWTSLELLVKLPPEALAGAASAFTMR